MDEADTTALARWMTRFRVNNRELGQRAKIPENHIGSYRTGKKRPGDPLKVAIWNATKEIETELGIADAKGVTAIDWFSEAEIAQLANGRRAANGSAGGR